MPLSHLEGYGSDSGLSIQSHNSDAVLTYRQDNHDSNATASDSEDGFGDAKKSTGSLIPQIHRRTRLRKNQKRMRPSPSPVRERE
jgi:hypothetical protein